MQMGGKAMSLRAAAGVLAAAMLTLALPAPAPAQGLFESFFDGLSRALQAPQREPAPIRAFAEPAVRFERTITPPSVHVETGPAKAFCVRTCDGHFFPVRAHAGMSAAEACHAFCPASETRLYSGSTIDYAIARDGSRYAALDTAYVYRKHLVAGCTCNGRDQFGLARVDVSTDPTLRPGDVVATRNGMVAFTGRKDNSADFTPVESYAHFSKGYRDSLAAMQIMPPNPGAPPATPVKLPLSSATQGPDRSASR
jgi:Protein of unknown function (DUF2865)